MPKFTIKFTFQGHKYKTKIEADSLYAAHIEFKRYIHSKILIESVDEEKPPVSEIDTLMGILGIKK